MSARRTAQAFGCDRNLRLEAQPTATRLAATLGITLLVLFSASQGFASEPSVEHNALEEWAESTTCDESASHCFELEIFIAEEASDSEGDLIPVAEKDWLEKQLARTNELFAPAEIQFRVGSLTFIGSDAAHIETKDDRDALGHDRFKLGRAPVYIVGQLDNVDADGEINGVHWRYREDRSKRWIIVSHSAWSRTLGHELGHFFGLPHGDAHESVMNKSVRAVDLEDLRFVEDELKTIKKHRKRHLRSGRLVPSDELE